jgi:hypothetical protein
VEIKASADKWGIVFSGSLAFLLISEIHSERQVSTIQVKVLWGYGI